MSEQKLSVEIRPLRDNEVAALNALSAEIWRAHYPGIISVAQIESMLAERYNEAVIREELQRGDVWWDVLLLNGQMTGYTAYFLTDTRGMVKIDKLYLHPRAHRQGYGGQLIDQFGIRVTPSVRYTRWLGESFNSFSTISKRNQIEAIITIGF